MSSIMLSFFRILFAVSSKLNFETLFVVLVLNKLLEGDCKTSRFICGDFSISLLDGLRSLFESCLVMTDLDGVFGLSSGTVAWFPEEVAVEPRSFTLDFKFGDVFWFYNFYPEMLSSSKTFDSRSFWD